MLPKYKYPVAALLSALGLLVSLYLSWNKVQGTVVPCGVTGGCNFVLSSQYATFVGVPLPYWGAAFFLLALTLSLLALRSPRARQLLLWVSGAGFLFALYLIGIQLVVLQKICRYCLTTDTASIGLFLWLLNVADRVDRAPDPTPPVVV